MRKRDKVELTTLAGVVAATAALRGVIPLPTTIGEAVLSGAALLLGQGLIRDIWLKYFTSQSCGLPPAPGRATPQESTPPPAACMCAESTIGIIGIIAGALALLFGNSGTDIALPKFYWPMAVACIGLLGFLMKDLVIDWKRRRVRWVANHFAIRFNARRN